jgi:hypothetical protein
MEKRTGWGAGYPDNIRNGDWEYRGSACGRRPGRRTNAG